MSRAKKRKMFDCIEYLSVEAPLEKVDYLEDKQSKYIREYVKNKEYSIVGTERRHGFSQGDVNRQWAAIVKLIRAKRVDGVVIANMAAVSDSVPDAFYKVGQIVDAGGIIVTVDEGRLDMNIKRDCNEGEE
ncbi:MAG: recombinase family protein [Clostridium sp.]|nr:recombinase family protein [Clostridium sp.]